MPKEENNSIEGNTGHFFKIIYCNMFKKFIFLTATCQGDEPPVSFLSEKLLLKGLVEFEVLIKDLISWQAC